MIVDRQKNKIYHFTHNCKNNNGDNDHDTPYDVEDGVHRQGELHSDGICHHLVIVTNSFIAKLPVQDGYYTTVNLS